MSLLFLNILFFVISCSMARLNYNSGKAGSNGDLIWCGVFISFAIDRFLWIAVSLAMGAA